MPRRYKLLIFDWDGTLMDSAAAIAASIQSACRDLGLRVPTEGEARYIIGLGLDDAMKHLLPELEPAFYPRLVDRYRQHFLQRDAGTGLFPGTVDAVRKLHAGGHLLAIATGKSRRGLDRALRTTGLTRYFHRTRCADEGYSKPHPGMLQCLLDELNVPASSALMIGDTTHDMDMARAAGVDGLAVTYGAHGREALVCSSPIACVDRDHELWQWLEEHA
ncbi:MAG: HAD-IA family hydrolase [Rhodospirillaceae bacterium]